MTYDSAQQLVHCFETLGMTPEQIAEGLTLDATVVKAALHQYSRAYRDAAKTDTSLDYTEDEAANAKRIALSIMEDSDDDRLRAKIALRVIDDKKGRLEPVVAGRNLLGGAGSQINIVLLQQHLSAVESRLSSTSNRTLPVPAREAKMLQDAKISTVRKSDE